MQRVHADRTWRLLRQISWRILRATEKEQRKETHVALAAAHQAAELAAFRMTQALDSMPKAKARRRGWA